ncbi:PRA1 family protein G2-like [Pyrus ussuriensis x Pyrus communis]|uniref:PRA1 family protein n=1 Tax=Pyrus ussuriensis x Pyrus communis TaxID=2448454 RepID=A0A5N5GPS4_9ROSA|nr:PRA1 family protein G2-like [Pyrus ussuriensis x Pyrus communis]
MSPSKPQSHSVTATTYTSIPISVSGSDAITRSIKNLNDAVSRRRPWSEFASSISRLDSLSSALTRIQTNANHFRVNYLLLIALCGALSLIGSPRWLLVTAAVVGLWLVIYVFREDPLEVWGHHVSDWAVMAGLVVVSGLVAWASSGLVNVTLGLGVGLVLCGVHGLLRNTEGLFLNENEAASQGLIGPTSSSV